MGDWYVPVSILVSMVLGAFLRMIYGYLVSGESFNPSKFAASSIMTLMLGLGEGLGLVASSIITDTTGLITFCVQAVVSGWGIVLMTTDITTLQNKASKPK
jgi:hypothetical protein